MCHTKSMSSGTISGPFSVSFLTSGSILARHPGEGQSLPGGKGREGASYPHFLYRSKQAWSALLPSSEAPQDGSSQPSESTAWVNSLSRCAARATSVDQACGVV